MNHRVHSSGSVWLAAGLLLAATAIWVMGLGADSLWFDEAWSAHAAAQSTLIAAANADATNPPIYYSLLYLYAQTTGHSEFALRSFSLLLALLTAALSAAAARQWYGRRAGLIALALVLALPLLGWGAQEARMYTLLAALVVIAALAWERLRTGRATRHDWLLLWSAELAMLYAHNSGPVIVLWLNAVTLLAWLAARSPHRPDWRVWLAGQIGVGLLWLPYFVTRFILLADANAALTSAPALTPTFLFDLWRTLWITPYERVALTDHGAVLVASLGGGLLLIMGITRRGGWPLLHALILTSGLIAALIVLGNEFHGRYLVMIAPLIMIGWAGALAALKPRWIAPLLVGGVMFVSLGDRVTREQTAFRNDDARGMVQFYADRLTAADTVLAWSYADRYELAYYWDRLGVTARRVTLPEGADWDAIAPLLPTSGDVAVNIWYTQRADFRGMLGCRLAHGTTRLPEEFTTHGMTTRIYTDPALTFAPPTDADAVFTRLDGTPSVMLVNVGGLIDFPADHAQCLPIRVELLTDQVTDLRAAIIVRDADNRIVAETNAIFATADQRTTGTLPAGTIVEAFPLVRLPYGTLPGEYTIALRVYDTDAYTSGYVPPADRALAGRDLRLGAWTAEPALDWAATGRTDNMPRRVNLIVGTRRLIGYNLFADVLTGPADLTLWWDGSGPLPPVTLAGEGWSAVTEATLTDPPAGVVREVRTLNVPPDASGSAVLALPDAAVIARYMVEQPPFVTTPPDWMQPLPEPIVFPGVGRIIGMNAAAEVDGRSAVTLIWQAEAPTPISYTVFVQMLDADGRILAQSDLIPAARTGARPTTAWRAGEIISDEHHLQRHEGADPAAAARWIVGLYDAVTGQRVPLVSGADAAELPLP